jgi:methyl coenzyme M reductase subunit C
MAGPGLKKRKPRAKGGKINKIVGTKRGEKVRGDIIAEIMKKKGMKLGEASRYVKEHGLY